MPSSYVDNVAPIVHALVDMAPRSVIDIGPGWGLYGLACRSWLPDLQFLEAIEVKEGYKPTPGVIYDFYWQGDVREVHLQFWKDRHYDLALLIDVIEHMTMDEGCELLGRILTAGTKVLVSTPKVFMEQHDEHNPYEEHVSLWTWQDLCARYVVERDLSTINSIIYVLGGIGG